MKPFIIIILSICLPLFLLSCHKENVSLYVISYNLRYDSPHDGDNMWKHRKEGLAELLKSHSPDIIGTQEGQIHQLDYIKSQLVTFKMIGVDRENNGEGEFSSIFYNTNALNLLQTETFWLSPTPNVPSLGWDASFKRICTYGLFESKSSNEQFLIFNTHFDHMGETARLESAALIVKKIKELNTKNLPVVLMGDFNCEPNSKPISTITNLLNDGKSISQSEFKGPIGTFSRFDRNATLEKRIDYIFVKNLQVQSYSHINTKISNGSWPSDHLPIKATLTK